MIRVPQYSQAYPWKYLLTACNLYQIDWPILASIVKVESDGNQYAYRYEPNFSYLHDLNILQKQWRVSAISAEVMQKSSYGYCQIMGATAIDLGLLKESIGQGIPTSLFEPHINFKYACLLIKNKIKEYGNNPELIYAAYNAGSVRRVGGKHFVNQWAVDKFNKAYKDFIGNNDVVKVSVIV